MHRLRQKQLETSLPQRLHACPPANRGPPISGHPSRVPSVTKVSNHRRGHEPAALTLDAWVDHCAWPMRDGIPGNDILRPAGLLRAASVGATLGATHHGPNARRQSDRGLAASLRFLSAGPDKRSQDSAVGRNSSVKTTTAHCSCSAQLHRISLASGGNRGQHRGHLSCPQPELPPCP